MSIIRYILGVLFFISGVGIGVLGALALYARNIKIGLISLILALFSFIGSYESFFFKHPWLFWLIIVVSAILIFLGLVYITEPELGIIDRFKSPEKLIREGKKEKAALKFRRAKKFLDAAKIYEDIGWISSATFCYEEAGEWEKAAQLYIKMAEKEDSDYNLRKAKEIYEEKLKDYKKAAEILERMAAEEEWYWEDAAKMWKKVGNEERAKECWRKALNYYKERSEKDDGVFWSDVAMICERLNDKDSAVDAYKKFLDYSKSMYDKEDRGWMRHVTETYYALYRLTGDEDYKRKGDESLEEYKKYLDETIKDEEYKKKLIEEVKEWLNRFVDPREKI